MLLCLLLAMQAMPSAARALTVLDYEPHNNPVADNVTRLSVSKLDGATRDALEGAALSESSTGLKIGGDDTYVEDDDDARLIASWTSAKKAEVIEGTLSVDVVYVIEETKAPDGYARSAEKVYFALRSEDFNTRGSLLDASVLKVGSKVRQLAQDDWPDCVEISEVSGSGNSQAFVINMLNDEVDGSGDSSSKHATAAGSRAVERLARTGDPTRVGVMVALLVAGCVALAIGLKVRTRS